MDKKLQTSLRYFKFNNTTQSGIVQIDWYKFDLFDDSENRVCGFTDKELGMVTDYVVSNQLNFYGAKNYHRIKKDELPMVKYLDLVTDQQLIYPSYLIIKPIPDILNGIGISKIMEAMLLSEKGEYHHTFNLPFGIIGKILNT